MLDIDTTREYEELIHDIPPCKVARIHKTAEAYAVPRKFRLVRLGSGHYFLVDSRGEKIDTPAWGGTTAAGAIRMMRRHMRQGRTMGRALYPAPIVIKARKVSR